MRRARAALFVALVALAGCAKAERATPPTCDSAGPVVDATLLAFLSKARALHHEADVKEDTGDLAGAIAALDRIFAGETPRAPEADEVLADTRARVAELRAKTGDFDRAKEDVEEGLRRAKETTYFRGHLYEVLGLVEEKRALALDEKGDAAGAKDARKRALDASEEAVKIQEQVIGKALAPRGSASGR